MRELLEHPAYNILKRFKTANKGYLAVDYVILENDSEYVNFETHRQAVIECYQNMLVDQSKMVAEKVSSEHFFDTPKLYFSKREKPLKNCGSMLDRYSQKYCFDINSVKFDEPIIKGEGKPTQFLSSSGVSLTNDICLNIDFSYCKYALTFLDTPYWNNLTINDFKHFNNILFYDKSNLEIYDWCANLTGNMDTDINLIWCNYFYSGLEWWGSYCWSIYDKTQNIFVVISASETD